MEGVFFMLVLKREAGEVFYIGPDIEIKIESIDSGQVKISINAPREYTVIRKEMLETPDNQVKDREAIAALRKKIKSKQKMKRV